MTDAEKGNMPETSDEPVNIKFNMNVANRDPNGINEHLKVSWSSSIKSFVIDWKMKSWNELRLVIHYA